MGEKMTPCAECGMPCEPGEYHPYAACLMFKGCHNSTTVRANLPQPAQAAYLDGTDNEVLGEFIRICREVKPVGRWPGDRVCSAIERLMANQKPFRFIAESDTAPQRGHNGRGGDGDRPFSGPLAAALAKHTHQEKP